jgi:hypothetical protein
MVRTEFGPMIVDATAFLLSAISIPARVAASGVAGNLLLAAASALFTPKTANQP